MADSAVSGLTWNASAGGERRRPAAALRLSRKQKISLALGFVASAIATTILCDGYLMSLYRVSQCIAQPAPGLEMVFCGRRGAQFYYSGSLYLGINKELIDSLRRADVVILGNSRTQRTFASQAIQRYFEQKGLRYFVMASEGSGFRFSQLILERLDVRPKILMINNESFYIDVLEDSNREVVLSPERFTTEMTTFYYSKKVYQYICGLELGVLKRSFCSGGNMGTYRYLDTGVLYIPPYQIDRSKYIPLEVPPETRLGSIDFFMKNVRAFFDSPSTKDACVVNYIVPSNNASVDLARAMSERMGAAFVYPPIDTQYYTSDTSHLVPESSEIWSQKFVRLLDPHLDACIARKGIKPQRRQAAAVSAG